MQVALAQIDCILGDVDENLRRAREGPSGDRIDTLRVGVRVVLVAPEHHAQHGGDHDRVLDAERRPGLERSGPREGCER